MCAVVAVLNENLTESLKGFYKLRKAYFTLAGILEAEERYFRNRSTVSVSSHMSSTATSTADASNQVMDQGVQTKPFHGKASEQGGLVPNPPAAVPSDSTKTLHMEPTEGGSTESFGNGNGTRERESSVLQGLKSPQPGPEKEMNNLNLVRDSNRSEAYQLQVHPADNPDRMSNRQMAGNPMDIFIQSGSNLCFGLLLVIIAMIPPAFGRLLSIVGFRGDRERGLKMLWWATTFSNVNSALAGLILLGMYTGIAAFCDILPDDADDEVEGYSQKRCEELLLKMRNLYPKSRLWLLEEARMSAVNQKLEKAIDLLTGSANSQIKQVDALAMFERSLSSMYLHRYEDTTQFFLKVDQIHVRCEKRHKLIKSYLYCSASN